MDERTIARFWAKVDKNGPVPEHRPELGKCWVWTGKTNSGGYGRTTAGRRGKKELCHKLAWTYSVGPIPQPIHDPSRGVMGTCVLHKCDNPSCCNPQHLFLGTQYANIADRHAKGRDGAAYGNANGTRLYPEKLARGDRNPSRRYPERLLRGDATWGRTHPTKLGYAKAEQIRARLQRGITQGKLAREFGVSQSMISMVKRNLSWPTTNTRESKEASLPHSSTHRGTLA